MPKQQCYTLPLNRVTWTSAVTLQIASPSKHHNLFVLSSGTQVSPLNFNFIKSRNSCQASTQIAAIEHGQPCRRCRQLLATQEQSTSSSSSFQSLPSYQIDDYGKRKIVSSPRLILHLCQGSTLLSMVSFSYFYECMCLHK